MPVLELITSSGLGSLLGMRHALEPDHLAAVSTLVSGERNSAQAALLGVCWGLGHTFSLLVVGTILVALRAEMPARIADGVRVLRRADADRPRPARDLPGGAAGTRRPGARPPSRRHGARASWRRRHTCTSAHWTLARRPLIVGAVHGLAGSGALTALVVTTLPSTAARITYMRSSGWDRPSGWPRCLGCSGGRWRVPDGIAAWHVALRIAVGCVSTVLGLFWGYPLAGKVLGF